MRAAVTRRAFRPAQSGSGARRLASTPLRRLQLNEAFHLPAARGDETRRPGGLDPRGSIPIKKVRDIYIPDLHIDKMSVKAGDMIRYCPNQLAPPGRRKPVAIIKNTI